jgi:ATP-dependent DNA helicase RecQ
LELDGYLSGGTPFYSTYRFQPLRSSQEILAEFEGERREFVEQILKLSKKGRTWFQIDLDQATKVLAAPRDRVVRALDYLAERGWLKLEAAGTRHRYRRLRTPADRKALAESLHARCVDRERREVARLAQIVEFAGESECQVASLCRHFGEIRTVPCGHCTGCLGKATAGADLRRTVPPLDERVLAEARSVRRENPALAEAVAMARWLCGITSPALSKAKLSSHRLFGALAQQPFSQLLARLESETGKAASRS